LPSVLGPSIANDRLAAKAYQVMADVQTRAEQSQPYLERAVAIARRLPPTDLERIGDTTALASLYVKQARFDRARVLFDEALAGAELVNGGRSTILVRALTESAVLDGRLGDYARGEAKERRALALAEDLVGPESFQVADGLNDLAVTLVSEGHLREAVQIFKQSYERHARIFGEPHWRTVNVMRNIGIVQLLLDEPRECEAWMERALRASEPLADRQQQLRVYMGAQLARCVLREGQSSRAVFLLEQALTRLQPIADNPSYIPNVRLWLGRARFERGELDEAETQIAEAVAYYRRTREGDHPVLAEAECDLAQVLATKGRRDEALALVTKCVPRVITYGQMEPWRTRSHERLLATLRVE
jgi:tetratricopeptide (TPR) repeat protein